MLTRPGIVILAPQLDINTVAAGGGSCLTIHSGLLHVGPESAGADPGAFVISATRSCCQWLRNRTSMLWEGRASCDI